MTREGGAAKAPARLRVGAGALSALGVLGVLGILSQGCGPSASVKSGDVLFAENCARCHGADGKGDPRALPLYPRLDLTRSPMGIARDRILISDRIARGYTTMPGFQGKLQGEEIGNLVNKCLALAAKPAPNGG
ncbi:MAG TPA: cytochrome c [Thermoanaerobaculia bacterium]|jgi:mono/diheme cytochrome c family protein|nr:cytochrome c [Thermoanaerobaculia bacterium]